MPTRIVLLGDHPAGLGQQIDALPHELDLEVVGTWNDVAAARRALATLTPDVAIVASSISAGSGFDFISHLCATERPAAVVFLSACEADAVRAFELQATDFIPVPVQQPRLEAAMVRARHQALQSALLRTAEELRRLIGATTTSRAAFPGSLPSTGFGSEVELMVGVADRAERWAPQPRDTTEPWRAEAGPFVGRRDSAEGVVDAPTGHETVPWRARPLPLPTPAGRVAASDGVLDLTQTAELTTATKVADRPKRVLIREGRRTRFVPLLDVDWFEADGNYILVHTAGERYRTRGTIAAIELGLDPRQFVRIHRRMVVNMDRVREMSPLPGGDGLLLLGSGATLRLSRTYRSRVR